MFSSYDSSLSELAREVGTPDARVVDLLVIHCSATVSGRPLRHGKMNAAQVIDSWHAARGFKRATEAVRAYSRELPAIGYHYVIDLDGTVWAGRHLEESGAHAAGYNARSVGVCLVGGVEAVARYTSEQWTSLRKVVTQLIGITEIPLASAFRPAGVSTPCGICGHRDLSPDLDGSGRAEEKEWFKTCPGFDVDTWLARNMVPEFDHIFTNEEGVSS